MQTDSEVKNENPHTEKCPVDLLVSSAVEKWGNATQMLLTMEECGELIVAINHFLRGRKDKRELAEEIADVEIMCTQMRYMIGDEIVDKEKHRKLRRLGERLGLYEIIYGG